MVAALSLALASCERPAPESDGAAPSERAQAPGTSVPAGNAVDAAAGSERLPVELLGRWDASAAACAGTRGEMRLDVEADRLDFYESHGRIERVRRTAAGAYEVDLAFEGEGERWIETRWLRLLPDGRLSVETPDGAAERVRCP